MRTTNFSKSLKLLRRVLSTRGTDALYNKMSLLLLCALIGLAMSIEVINPLLLKHIIDRSIAHSFSDGSLIVFMVIAYGSLWLFADFCMKLKELIVLVVFQRSLRRLSIQLFDHLHSLSLGYHANKKTGELTSSLSLAQTGLISIFYGLFLFCIPALLGFFVASLIFAYRYGFLYSGIMLSVVSTYLFVTLESLQWLADAEYEYTKKETGAESYFVDSLLNAESVKLFNNQQFEHEQFEKRLLEREIAAKRTNIRQQLIAMIQSTILGCGLTIILTLTSYRILDGSLTAGDFVLINGYIIQCIMPLSYFGLFIQSMRKSLVDLENVIKIQETVPDIQDSHQATHIQSDTSEIVFENVSFSYKPDTYLLKGVSLHIRAGQRIGIVGATGCGKSTLARLLFRLYDVSSGSITIDGHDIRTISQQSLHAHIGMVSQDTALFNNTVYYNIAYGNPYAHSSDIDEVVERACLRSFIDSLPERYNTIVGERGIKLSSGERQRIAIARVLLKRPKIYIFDEATSSLDYSTEKEIQSTINEISHHATTLIIAHRLSTLVDVDEIVVLENGIIVEQGPHDQLLSNNRTYAYLWNKQYSRDGDTI